MRSNCSVRDLMMGSSERSNKKQLWVDKYKPQSLEELAVHKKKVNYYALNLFLRILGD